MRIEKIQVSQLKENERNPRKITKEAFEKLKKSIKDFPQMLELRPLVIDEKNVILGGNMRLKAFKDLGIKEVSVVRAEELTEEQKKRFVVVDNLPFGIWDYDVLGADYEAGDLTEWGFNDLKDLELAEDNFDEEKALGSIVEPITKPGDVYELGPHRLVCGDSTKPEDWEKLMKGEKARLIFTDPPYNVNYLSPSGHSYAVGKYGEQGIFNDNKSDEDAMAFYVDVLRRLRENTKDDACIYWWLAFNSNGLLNLLAFKEAGWKLSQQITWIKETMVFSRGQDYHRMPEPCFFGWKEGKAHFSVKRIANFRDVWVLNYEDFQQLPDVWFEHRDKTNEYVHPTQKPVKLAERALRKNSIPGDIVIDAFGGSGSLMVSCHQAGRVARLMELDPKFVDVIVTRMMKLDPRLEVKKNGTIIKW